MRNVFLRHEDAKGNPLPDGELQFRKFGPEGFEIKVNVPPGNDAAWKFLQEIEQILHWLGDKPIGDIDKGLRLVGEMEAYFTTWRQGDKFVPEARLREAQMKLEHCEKLKSELQADNDRANQDDRVPVGSGAAWVVPNLGGAT